jgi:hypothetical protein
MHDGAVVRRAARHADRARALAGRGFHYAHEALPANVDRVQRVRVRAFRRGRLMAEMPEGVPDAIRAGRSVRNALLGWRRVASDEDDPGLVDLGLRQRGLRDALRVHHDRVVGAVHDNGLVAGRDRARATQMVDLAVPRFAGCVAGLGSGDGGHVDAAVRHGRREADSRVGVRPDGDRDARGRATRRVRPREGRLTGGGRGDRCADVGYGH